MTPGVKSKADLVSSCSLSRLQRRGRYCRSPPENPAGSGPAGCQERSEAAGRARQAAEGRDLAAVEVVEDAEVALLSTE
jgi:hypothetical protein